MRLELTSTAPDAHGRFSVRLTVVNDTGEPVRVDRRLLYGPQAVGGEPGLLAAEPATRRADAIVLLNPGGVLGRERTFQYPAGEEVAFHGYLLARTTDGLGPTGPEDRSALAAEAPALTVSVR